MALADISKEEENQKMEESNARKTKKADPHTKIWFENPHFGSYGKYLNVHHPWRRRGATATDGQCKIYAAVST